MNIKVSSNLQKVMNSRFDLNNVLQKALIQSSLLVQNSAKEFAPYDTWKLRQSITTNLSKITQLQAIIWSPLPYARRRNYENNKNPQTKLYLVTRAYEVNKSEILRLVWQNLKTYLW